MASFGDPRENPFEITLCFTESIKKPTISKEILSNIFIRNLFHYPEEAYYLLEKQSALENFRKTLEEAVLKPFK